MKEKNLVEVGKDRSVQVNANAVCLDLSAYNEEVIPEIQFHEVGEDDVTSTGRGVLCKKEEWRGKTYACSNALVAFFFELTSMYPFDNNIQKLMERHGIELTNEK